MKFIFVGIFIFFFVMIPMYLLNTIVMPALNSLEYSYANQGQTVQSMVGRTTTSNTPSNVSFVP